MSVAGLIEINSCKNFKSYIKKIYEFPILNEEEESLHLYRFSENNNRESAQILITSHLKLVVKIAMLYKYKGCSIPVRDLISEGTIGLIESLKKFDISKKCRLATYAIFYIKSKINDFIMNSFSLIKLNSSRATKKLFLKIKDIMNSIDNKDLEKIANESGVSLKNVIDMKTRVLGREISIDANFENESGSYPDNSLSKTLKSELKSPEEMIIESDDRKKKLTSIAYACINILDDQEKDIIANRILAENQMTLKELSLKYNIS